MNIVDIPKITIDGEPIDMTVDGITAAIERTVERAILADLPHTIPYTTDGVGLFSAAIERALGDTIVPGSFRVTWCEPGAEPREISIGYVSGRFVSVTRAEYRRRRRARRRAARARARRYRRPPRGIE